VIFPQGTFTPLVHAHAGRTQIVTVRFGPDGPPPDALFSASLRKGRR